jgi:hypothetical protein
MRTSRASRSGAGADVPSAGRRDHDDDRSAPGVPAADSGAAAARAYGFDAPNNARAPAAWRAKYNGYRETIPSVPCLGTSGKSSLRFAYGGNRGGYVATGHSNCNEVYNDQNIPTCHASCGSNSTAVATPWIGVGGYHSGKLIQQGFVSGSSGTATQGASPWYEYLNPAHGNPPVHIGHTTKTGHVISQYMTYSTGKVGFHWYDRTAGSGWTPATVSSSHAPGVACAGSGPTQVRVSLRPTRNLGRPGLHASANS